MDKFCGQCEKVTTHQERATDIKVGSRVFTSNINVCSVCGAYERDRDLRNKINEWGDALTVSFDTLQPRLSETIHEYLEHCSKEAGLDKSRLVRAMYAFYLNHAVRHPQFKKVREILKAHESSSTMEVGDTKTIPIRISFRAFRKLETYSLVWKCTPTRGIEDSIKFCISLEATVNSGLNVLLGELANKYREFVQDMALAA